MTRLRTIWGLNLKEIKEKFQIDLYSIKKNELNAFKKEKHIEINNNTIILKKKGKIISDYITEKIML
jgi:coproporphyrinogen III oxidase-like Fe-S oxidoreductase